MGGLSNRAAISASFCSRFLPRSLFAADSSASRTSLVWSEGVNRVCSLFEVGSVIATSINRSRERRRHPYRRRKTEPR